MSSNKHIHEKLKRRGRKEAVFKKSLSLSLSSFDRQKEGENSLRQLSLNKQTKKEGEEACSRREKFKHSTRPRVCAPGAIKREAIFLRWLLSNSFLSTTVYICVYRYSSVYTAIRLSIQRQLYLLILSGGRKKHISGEASDFSGRFIIATVSRMELRMDEKEYKRANFSFVYIYTRRCITQIANIYIHVLLAGG